jgi:tetratricopeptide (TPR) repeat protein
MIPRRTTILIMAIAIAACRPWRAVAGPVDSAEQLLQRGFPAAAESLFRAGEATGSYGPFEYLRWAQTAAVIGRYDEVAAVLCKALAREPRLTAHILNQASALAAEASRDTVRMMLRAFDSCGRAAPGVDGALFDRWLARAFADAGLDNEEDGVLVRMARGGPEAGRALLSAADGHFIARQFDRTVLPARLAWACLVDRPLLARAAAMLYQSYLQTGRADSAMAWFGRAGLRDPQNALPAVALLQNAGLLDKAESLLAGLPESPARDTLIVRQLLFAGKPSEALAAAQQCTAQQRWRPLASDALWLRARLRLFSGDAAGAGATLDSLRILPGWEPAAQAMEDRLRFRRLKPWPAALVLWSKIALANYVGGPVHSIFEGAGVLPDDARQALAIMRARALDAQSKPSDALLALNEAAPARPTTEFRYWQGAISISRGDVIQGRGILEKLILDQPGDLFAQRARVLLLQPNRI